MQNLLPVQYNRTRSSTKMLQLHGAVIYVKATKSLTSTFLKLMKSVIGSCATNIKSDINSEVNLQIHCYMPV